jgi:cytochrome oxidase assembly protein ShyY1
MNGAGPTMRLAAKHWLFFALLLASLAVMAALALWQMVKARREAVLRQPSAAATAPARQA